MSEIGLPPADVGPEKYLVRARNFERKAVSSNTTLCQHNPKFNRGSLISKCLIISRNRYPQYPTGISELCLNLFLALAPEIISFQLRKPPIRASGIGRKIKFLVSNWDWAAKSCCSSTVRGRQGPFAGGLGRRQASPNWVDCQGVVANTQMKSWNPARYFL